MTLPAHLERRVADLEKIIEDQDRLLRSVTRELARVDRPQLRLAKTAPATSGSPLYPAAPANSYHVTYLEESFTPAPGLQTPTFDALSAIEMGEAHFLNGKGLYLQPDEECFVVETRAGKRFILDPLPSAHWIQAELREDLCAGEPVAHVTQAVSVNAGDALPDVETAVNLYNCLGVAGDPCVLLADAANDRYVLMLVEYCVVDIMIDIRVLQGKLQMRRIKAAVQTCDPICGGAGSASGAGDNVWTDVLGGDLCNLDCTTGSRNEAQICADSLKGYDLVFSFTDWSCGDGAAGDFHGEYYSPDRWDSLVSSDPTYVDNHDYGWYGTYVNGAKSFELHISYDPSRDVGEYWTNGSYDNKIEFAWPTDCSNFSLALDFPGCSEGGDSSEACDAGTTVATASAAGSSMTEYTVATLPAYPEGDAAFFDGYLTGSHPMFYVQSGVDQYWFTKFQDGEYVFHFVAIFDGDPIEDGLPLSINCDGLDSGPDPYSHDFNGFGTITWTME